VADLALAQHTNAQQNRISISVGEGGHHCRRFAELTPLSTCLAGAA